MCTLRVFLQEVLVEPSEAVHHVLELISRMQDGGAEVEGAGALPEPRARDHAHAYNTNTPYCHTWLHLT